LLLLLFLIIWVALIQARVGPAIVWQCAGQSKWSATKAGSIQ
jgi:hypothetical protein